MNGKTKNNVTLREEELERIKGGIQIRGTWLITWILGKIAPGGII